MFILQSDMLVFDDHDDDTVKNDMRRAFFLFIRGNIKT